MSMQISAAAYLSYYLEEVEHVIVQLQIYISNSRMPQEPIFKCQQTMAFKILVFNLHYKCSCFISCLKVLLLIWLMITHFEHQSLYIFKYKISYMLKGLKWAWYLVRGLYKGNRRVSFLKGTFIVVKKTKEVGGNPMPGSRPCAGNQKK